MMMRNLDHKTRYYLSRKLLTICPVCKKLIKGKDIDILTIDKTKVTHWPLIYTHCHSHDKYPMHALTLYLDANFSVRSEEVTHLDKIQK